MKTVLIPTDFSENARHAIDFAEKLYWCERTHFCLLHAYADEVYGEFKNVDQNEFERQKERVSKRVKAQLSALVDNVTETPPNPKHTFEKISAFESLVDAVNDVANQKNVDLVVMGTRGKNEEAKITFGSHTVQVFKYVSCPVLAIPMEFAYRQPKKILFTTDYMLPFKRREIKLLADVARNFKSEIHCLHISDFDDLSHRQLDNKRFLRETCANCYMSFERTEVRNKTEAIMTHIKEHDIDLLVMVNSRHSFFEDMLYRSTVDEIGLTAKIPFLVMQNLPR